MKRNNRAKKTKKTKKRLDKSRKKSYNDDSGYPNHTENAGKVFGRTVIQTV